ncbi:MAG: ribonuclease Y [Ignavibacteriales bacterium]|nr:ribonuclease Y [Ignavibacteriales bacterium]
MVTEIILTGIIGITSFFIGWFVNAKIGQNKISSAEERAKKITADAERDAAAIQKEKLLEVKDEWYRKKHEFENDATQKRNKLQSYEKQLSSREENIDRKVELLNKKEKEVQALQKLNETKAKEHDQKLAQPDQLLADENTRLERASGMSRDEARKLLLDNLLDSVKTEAAQTLKDIRDKAKEDAKKEAQKIIVQAIQRSAADHAVETTVSVLQIQSDEMKGRIIGREGRNIRAFEAATGVDVIVDDTPEAVILSGFDAFRREVARISLERLIADGRIHPARIEEVVEKVKGELEEEVKRVGENTLLEVGLPGAHLELVKFIGKMKYRTSYGQNLLQHSIEVSYLCGIMAAELGLDINLAKRSGLLHDIGKTADRSIEGPHAIIGMEMTKKYSEHPIVVNAVGAHHDDIPMEHPISALVQAADSISGARPGARRESVEGYVKRLEKLEEIAKSFKGVHSTFAIQAGREIRVIVEHDKVDDAMADQLAQDIARKIQQEMEYPGQIKVVVIREIRAVSFAK